MTKTEMNRRVKEYVQHLLSVNDKAVERGLLAIYARQTAHEQVIEQTQEHNDVGFAGNDAEFLSSCAKSVQKYGSLTVNQLPWVRRRMMKYWRQLADVAAQNGKPITEQQLLVFESKKIPVTSANQAMLERLQEKASVQKAEAAEEQHRMQYKFSH